jgi:predicted ATPase
MYFSFVNTNLILSLLSNKAITIMTTKNVTPEQVQELYENYNNKQHFLITFGTKKFYLVDTDFLKRMYDYLTVKSK